MHIIYTQVSPTMHSTNELYVHSPDARKRLVHSPDVSHRLMIDSCIRHIIMSTKDQ